jgi:hypothetical protein
MKVLRAAVFSVVLLTSAHAELQDEIQVYVDDINDPGKFNLELHVNHTGQGRSVPDYPDEVTPDHGTRITAEFSYGISKTLEAGLYIPTNIESGGTLAVAGAKLRLKWLPIQPDTHGGWFAGENIELSRLQQRFSQSRTSSELRTILGYHSDLWLLSLNPVMDWNLSPGSDRSNPDWNAGFKVSRRIAPGILFGPEYYSDIGHAGNVGRWQDQSNTLYLVTDVERGPIPFQAGVGRGLNGNADRWTFKLIAEFPFG